MIRRPPRSTQSRSSAASDVYKRQGLYVRLRVMESPEFSEVKAQQTVLKQPALDAIRRYPREILTSALIRMSEQAPFYLFITFVLTYGTDKLNMAKGELLNYTIIAAAIGLVSVPFFGHLSDRYGRRLIYGLGVVC